MKTWLDNLQEKVNHVEQNNFFRNNLKQSVKDGRKIVKCRNCEYGTPCVVRCVSKIRCTKFYFSMYDSAIREKDDFCSYGERK
jgi:hypothetical protein